MKKFFLTAAGVLVLACVLRITNLISLPVFADEAIYIRWSQIMSAESTLRFLPLSDGKQPLFMWILMLLIKRFHDPLFIGRLISVVSGLATTVSIFGVSYYLFKSKVAALASAFFWAVSPFGLFFDRLALVDSMLALLGVLTMFLGVLTARTKRLDFAMLAGFSLGFAALTKSPALFFAILYPTTWLFQNWKVGHRERMKLLLRLGGLTLVTFVIAFGMYNILRLGPNFHLLSQRNYDYVYPYSHILSSPLDPFKGHMGGIWTYFVMLAPLGLTLLAILGAFTNVKKYKKEILVLTVWGIFPILLIAEYSKVVTARYVLFIMPFIVLLAGSALLITNQLLKKVALVLVLLFVVQSAIFDFNLLTNVEKADLPYGDRAGYLEEWTAGQGIREVSEYIKNEHARDGRKIVIGTEGYFGTLPDGLQMYLEGIPNVTTIGIGLGIHEIPTQLKESKKSGNKTYLVINKSRLSATPESMKLKLIAEYPKALRRVGSREYVEFGPQEVLYFYEVQ